MSSFENQQSSKDRKVYIPRLKVWVDVTEEQYKAYYQDIWAARKRAQYHHQCMCPKSKTWLCDGDCLCCPYHTAGDMLSLDYEIDDGEGNTKTLMDDLADDAPSIQSVVEDMDLLERLFKRLEQLNPEDKLICDMIMAGKSEREIAAALKIPRNTYTYRRDKLFELLKAYLGNEK